MRTTRAKVVLAGTLALTGLTGGAVLVPALATAATSEQSASAAVGDRVDRIKQALQGLVDDGTITAEQQDRVATTLGESMPGRGNGLGRGHGPGGMGPGKGLGHGAGGGIALGVAASTLGMTPPELMASLREGKSLADVAGEKGVSVEDLTAALVEAAEQRLAEKVTAGELTQEQADERKAELAERVDAAVQREGFPGRGNGMGHGWGPGGRPGAPDDAKKSESEPSTEGSSYTS
jgi:hypothetical protein